MPWHLYQVIWVGMITACAPLNYTLACTTHQPLYSLQLGHTKTNMSILCSHVTIFFLKTDLSSRRTYCPWWLYVSLIFMIWLEVHGSILWPLRMSWLVVLIVNGVPADCQRWESESLTIPKRWVPKKLDTTKPCMLIGHVQPQRF